MSIRDIKDGLKSLASTVNDTYTETMARIDSQAKDQKHLAYTTLSWVTHAMRPLSLPELECALAVRTGDTEFIEDGVPDIDVTLSACCGLVTVDTESHIVRLICKRSCSSRTPIASLKICARLYSTRLL